MHAAQPLTRIFTLRAYRISQIVVASQKLNMELRCLTVNGDGTTRDPPPASPWEDDRKNDNLDRVNSYGNPLLLQPYVCLHIAPD